MTERKATIISTIFGKISIHQCKIHIYTLYCFQDLLKSLRISTVFFTELHLQDKTIIASQIVNCPNVNLCRLDLSRTKYCFILFCSGILRNCAS